ncbi:hypothetical protein DRW03_31785 [Corallococcus sp. H22C18031201]|uniref:GNAT family N-acetyltransferase n=1 Tax=Citreicoccus inhibens TaxID=2849499 RepID=UPI000E7084B5|nr:GNAT family N-acetyltransferase [Citreicoccus inhibens]MBU8898686.1 GNAT family N-acetyltransferase [Citreicoccus inhibens]RJS15950.1 hypothetical protein DRW03_31785 [Corallococcus sp. H22C18031201]
MPHLRTTRLELKPFTQHLAREAMEDRRRFESALGVRVHPAWPGRDVAEALPFFASQPALGEWDTLLVHTRDSVLVGDMGFKGGPDEHGDVELGYSVVPEYRQQGLATEAARAMVAWAFQQPGVRAVVAECTRDNAASIGVLRRVGFRPVPNEDPLLLRWRITSGRD